MAVGRGLFSFDGLFLLLRSESGGLFLAREALPRSPRKELLNMLLQVVCG